MRTLIFALTLISSCAFSQTPLIKILSEELDRNFTDLKQKGEPPPYFMGYEVAENNVDTMSASEGSIDDENHNHTRYLDVTIRVGTPAFDNYHLSGGQRPRFTSATSLALPDDEDSIRRAVWLATDRVYRSASQRLDPHAAGRMKSCGRQHLIRRTIFQREEPQVFSSDPPKLNRPRLRGSSVCANCRASFQSIRARSIPASRSKAVELMQTLVTTEGTRLYFGRPFARIIIYARGKSPDGMDLQTFESFESDDASKLPSDAQILEAVRKAGANLMSNT